ncbi:putative methyltransferase C1347.09 [Ceratocystis fimbriata CBS 114723]|uniref:Putative methyltransferase C1347.09 n=1 Tax=Ceratocystis fimbriata CBS 114723 TaxID=1035309 RepID=A0A2C5WZR8_9PEZI|nr:putative methyltransferase C1347.09 [Ceratocystis fimbriata CBS 114723]
MAHTEALTENKAYFNDLAAKYDGQFGKTLDRLVEEIRGHRDFIGVDWVDDDDSSSDDDRKEDNDGAGNIEDNCRSGCRTSRRPVRLLDYACGTGLVSRALAPLTTQCVGIDISEAMVKMYNLRAENQGLAKEEMFAVLGDLIDPADPLPTHLSAPDFFNFDIAAVGLGAHHFVNPELAVTRLVERLKPGGVVMFIDFLEHVPMSSEMGGAHSVMHHGFSEQQVRQFFENGGAGEGFGMVVLGKGISFRGHGAGDNEVQRTVFIARGQKSFK